VGAKSGSQHAQIRAISGYALPVFLQVDVTSGNIAPRQAFRMTLIREQEAAGSNPAIPTGQWNLSNVMADSVS
jgi:hypothetical protein